MRRHIRIFKYMPINSAYGPENIKNLLSRNEVWLSSPAEFNDPLECKPVFENDLTPKHFLERYKQIKQNMDRRGFSVADHRIADTFNDLSITKIRKKLTHSFVRNVLGTSLIQAATDTFKETGVTCFSETGINSAMWAYYADGHQGVCASARVSLDEKINFVLERVEYTPIRPSINLSELVPQLGRWRMSSNDIRKFILTKSDHWAHEKEVRLLMPQDARQSATLNGFLVDRLILGVRCSPETKSWIRSLVPHGCIVSQAKFRSDSYDLEIE